MKMDATFPKKGYTQKEKGKYIKKFGTLGYLGKLDMIWLTMVEGSQLGHGA
jgi:hypothetical protein